MQTAGQARGGANIHTLQTVLCLPFQLFGIKGEAVFSFLKTEGLRAVKECKGFFYYFFEVFFFSRAELLFDETQLRF